VKHASIPHEQLEKDIETLLSMDSSLKIYTGSDAMSFKLMTQPTFPIYGLTSIIGNIFPAFSSILNPYTLFTSIYRNNCQNYQCQLHFYFDLKFLNMCENQ
jgi:hypothetical protein